MLWRYMRREGEPDRKMLALVSAVGPRLLSGWLIVVESMKIDLGWREPSLVADHHHELSPLDLYNVTFKHKVKGSHPCGALTSRIYLHCWVLALFTTSRVNSDYEDDSPSPSSTIVSQPPILPPQPFRTMSQKDETRLARREREPKFDLTLLGTLFNRSLR